MSLKKRVLFSLFDQEDAVDFARELYKLDWEIIATRETHTLLCNNGVASRDISDFLGIDEEYPFPPTLHPSLELALTTNKGEPIDFVYITPYPHSKGIDVGGHTILALAAKGNRIAVFNRNDMKNVISELGRNQNALPDHLRAELVGKVFSKVASHFAPLAKNGTDPFGFINEKSGMPILEGENPYQAPATLFRTDPKDQLAIPNFKQLSGELPCYTNLADLDSILKTLCLAHQAFIKSCRNAPHIAIAAKHGNPCGFAVDRNHPKEAVLKALFGNPAAIFGGEFICNFRIDRELAEALIASEKRKNTLGAPNWMLDLMAAPAYTDEALSLLRKSRRLKVFINAGLHDPKPSDSEWRYRTLRGGFLRQPPANYILDLTENASGASGRDLPEKDTLDSIIIAWATAYTSMHGGNEIALAKDGMLIGAGGGPSTIETCHAAIERARSNGHDTARSVFAADAFFPFTDAPEKLIKAGCVSGVAPKGGIKYGTIKETFEKANVTVFFLPEEYRGFTRH